MPRSKQFDEQLVLEKAMELFWKKGYYATSMQDLVGTLGINRASLYNTYGGKESLFLRAFDHYRAINRERLAHFFETQSDVKAGLATLLENSAKESLEDCDRKGCFAANITSELLPNDERILGVIEQHQADIQAILYNYLQKGVTQGQIPPNKDLKSIAYFLFTFLSGLKIIGKVDRSKERLLGMVRTALAILN